MNPQGTPEWMADRCGKITASRIADLLAKPRKGNADSATRRNYRADLVCERTTKKTRDNTYQTWEMKRGNELEPFAQADYEVQQGVTIDNTGFVQHPRFEFAGASPDGLIGTDGLVQFKCPNAANHLDYLTSGIVPSEYRPQMLWEMACTGRQWCEFVSYHPDMPEHLQLFIVRFYRDEVEIGKIEEEVIKFNAEVEEIIKHLPNGKTLAENLAASIKQAHEKKLDN